jgi:lipoprotein-anchoring transpeptidase ErfK/SrfK
MKRLFFLTLMSTVGLSSAALAQGWRWSETEPPPGTYRERRVIVPAPYWEYRASPRYDSPYRDRYYSDDDDDYDYRPRRRPTGPKLLEGGGRPPITPIPPERVSLNSRHAAGTIIIDTAGRQLFLIGDNGSALRYPISVGRQGFTWTGEEKISRIAEWPDWHPPAEMRERDPKLPEKMTGGVKNPLGAKALYLGNTLYRIHGTNDARTIGRAASSGCFRMLNGHVVDLADRVKIGAKVVVVSSLRSAGIRVTPSG